MLVSPTINTIDDGLGAVLSIIGGGESPTPRIIPGTTGLLLAPHFNVGHYLDRGDWEDYPDLGEHCSYGVCDSPEQFLSHEVGGFVAASKRRFCVGFCLIERDHQPQQGGWRWHKWGPYIGAHAPQYEYLAHERDIERVYCYHVYEQTRGF